jgi:type VI secretion system protein ImpH
MKDVATAPQDDDHARNEAFMRLLDDVTADPRAHDFFALLRRIESLHRGPRWGRAARPSQEPLRLSQDAELDFAPAALSTFDREARPVPRLGVRLFGLFGSQGPMPLHVTEYVRERLRAHGDPTLARFADIFHHRLLTFFYRAWAEAQPTTHLDRAGDRDADDRYSSWLGSAFGVDRAARRDDVLPTSAELYQAGLLASRSRHAEGLRKVLAQYFKVPVTIEEHVPQWLAIDPLDRSRLGVAARNGRTATLPAVLGRSATSGSKCFDRQFKFRIVLGPLTLERYASFFPTQARWKSLKAWVEQYAGLDLRWDVRLVLDRDEVPPPRLGRSVRLGLTAWLGGRAPYHDRGDLRLRPLTTHLTD